MLFTSVSSFIREIKLYRGGASWAPPPTAIKERMIHMDMVFDLIATLVACMCCPSAAAKVVNEAEVRRMFPRKGYLEMLKYDTETQRLTIAGSGGEIMSDAIALVIRVCNSITRGDVVACRTMVHVFAGMIDKAADDDGLFEVLAEEMESTTTVDLSHIMNGMKRGKEGEQ